jgi:hypothetical protein
MCVCVCVGVGVWVWVWVGWLVDFLYSLCLKHFLF